MVLVVVTSLTARVVAVTRNWIVEGAASIGKHVGDEMSKEHRTELRILIRNQYSSITRGEPVICPCGRRVDTARRGYRCFFCGVVFCQSCAKKHFTKKEEPCLKPQTSKP